MQIKNNEEWEVLTPSGWSDFGGIKKNKEETIKIVFDDNSNIICTKNHLLKQKNNFKKAFKFEVGEEIDCFGEKIKKIKEINNGGTVDVFDLLNVKEKNEYFTNNIISHNCLYVDEFAHLPANIADEFWTAILPTIGGDSGRVIIVSTPNGAAGLYYDLWRKATLNLEGNSFVPHKASWNAVPGRSEEWKQNIISAFGDGGKIKFAQEYDLNFTGSSHTLIEGNKLMNMRGIDPILKPEPGYHIWKRPQRNRLYMIGGDVAKGSNSDFSVANIFDVTDWHINGKYEQVAMFRKNDIPLFDFVLKLVWLTKQWYNPVVVIENNQIGAVVADALFQEHEYENTYFDYEKQEYGINANVKTKPLACTYMKEDLENNLLTINSNAEVAELGYFEEVRPGVFKARSGNNYFDDTVSSTYWVSYALRSKFWEDHIFYLKKDGIIGSTQKPLTNVNKNEPEQSEDEQIAATFMKSFFGNNPTNDFQSELSKF